ncbi:hypothetical protein PsYK624_009480 [Phanerochaete sordida]|uniref:TRP C-terminal domain-containing protein n=1 Tax=Phanerochaete sordida TaxID=48140 RepID=A0A9P3FYJ9_9APHY|nr:hypothetical protein PsYK624_009480 [Phanerochaete sordida]
MFILLLLSLSLALGSLAQPVPLQYSDCFSDSSTGQKLSISNVYAQYLRDPSGKSHINITLFGNTPQEIQEASNGSDPVATTLFTTTSMLTFDVWNNNSYFCSTLRPPSPLPNMSSSGSYCPFSPGPFALSSSIHLGKSYALATFDTRLRALDPMQRELLCLDVNTTILQPNSLDPVYGDAQIVFWCSVALAIAYWLLVGLARLASAWGRGSTRNGRGLWARVESAGFILASAISGERLATSPALMRFCTPSLRDIIFHTQWCAALAMVAVQWPTFIYPLLSQTAWSTLSYNITVSQGSTATRWNPLAVPAFTPPEGFTDQLNDPNSVVYINTSAPNFLFQLPENASFGIESFAYSVGLRPQDLFGICLSVFLAIIAATIVVSLAVWGLDWIASLITGSMTSATPPLTGSRSPRYSSASKDMLDGISQLQNAEDRSSNGHGLFRTTSRFPYGRPWWRLRSSFVSFHGSVLQGNLIRILILFHLPVTIFSCYQMTLDRSRASLASIILAAISFSVLSVLLPIALIVRLTFTNTTKLYDETWTLLSLGPLYNHYRHGSQLFACLLFATNLAFGITIGCGQRSGTAQAIVILVVEVISALGTSVWLPWGHGASMGLISFLFCVARIVIAVLLVILTPIVSVGSGAAQWVAYAILFILGLIYLAFVLMLIVKLIEGVVRIFGGVGFHESRHVVDSGLLGALGLVGCCSSGRRNRRSRYRLEPQPTTLPLKRPSPAFKDVTPTPSGPPSVLRPEHALQPYKEESDDETGFIMGAWQPFPRPGYNAVDEQPTPEPPKSGFARVGGGRAHYDSPYAIQSSSLRGSNHTFPSSERNAGSSNFQGQSYDYSPPATPSISSATVARQADVSLPPGAMPPAHVRTKSQTAIIEDASALVNLSDIRPSQGIIGQVEDEEDSEAAQPRKKWFGLRRNRRPSELDPEPEAPPANADPGRSFVVVRKSRPGTATNNASPSAESSEPRSFTVLRGNNAGS